MAGRKKINLMGNNPIPEWSDKEKLAELVGLTPKYIVEFQQNKVIEREGDMYKYDTRKALLSIIRYYREKNRGNHANRLTKAKADIAEVELMEKRGDLIRLDVAKEKAIDVFGGLARDLDEMPVKISAQLNPTDPEHACEILEDEIKRIFKNCRNRLLKKYKLEE